MKEGKLSPAGSRFVTIADLAALFDVSQRTIYNWVDRGYLPRPFHVTPRYVRWLRSEIDKVLNKKLKLRA